MATPYSDIYDLFMMQLTDYRLINLFSTSETDFATYLQGFLILAIPEFAVCNQNLENRTDASATFNFDMNTENKTILSMLMLKKWLGKEVRDVLQMRWSITDRDFKHYAEANNLREKESSLTHLKEELSQRLVAYGLRNTDWGAWASQNFND